ncbi:cytochrome P450 [Amycolatopsis bartoniae]|uniref:Cytochrome P450 n=1 Tax=Amycolatopsis bartoniae TaxID=941986 RepID=A0A8H9MG30_9PSEU|nr:cytochrome P450 [Amycolatopsis bartoniae]MBB2933889.1 cytochrome P450 [Amycolatopsis bartoniae]TVS99254.1 cytochrome P450 [Amycolatopsis bartoniae]GHF88334.1 cytochrome P450 [Amycolatopsis bartoniae]
MAHDHKVLSTRAACLAALRSPALTSNPGSDQANLLFLDGQAHARLRTVVWRMIARAEPLPDAVRERVEAIVRGLGDEFDLVADFARPIAAAVAEAVLGVELPPRVLADLEAVTANLDAWFGEGGAADTAALRLAMFFARAGVLPEAAVTEEERLVTPVVLAHAAVENSRNFLALAGLRLVTERRTRDVRELVNEITPARLVYRRATEDVTLAGHAVRAGETVAIRLDAGLPFGSGPHACPGSGVALAEAEVALRALARVLRPEHRVRNVLFGSHPVFYSLESAVVTSGD